MAEASGSVAETGGSKAEVGGTRKTKAGAGGSMTEAGGIRKIFIYLNNNISISSWNSERNTLLHSGSSLTLALIAENIPEKSAINRVLSVLFGWRSKFGSCSSVSSFSFKMTRSNSSLS